MKDNHQPPPPPPPPPPASTAPPASNTSSPSHEFSFTISLHQSTKLDKTKPLPSFAVDLTPADDIFFNGHLLPLHLLSHLPVSPRSSTSSFDSFTLPIHELSTQQNPKITSTSISTHSNDYHQENKNNHSDVKDGRIKSKSFSFAFFGLQKWRKGCEVREKKKLKIDLSHVLKRYMRMVRPLLSFKGRRSISEFYNQSHSFSGNLNSGHEHDVRGMRAPRGEFSAPASMRTSPTNSGLLVGKECQQISTATSDSTMEELQAAIQAAIAHCKNSNAAEENKN